MVNFFNKIEAFFKKIIEKMENSKIGLSSWLLTFICVIFIRNLLETFSSKINVFDIKNFYFSFFHSLSYYGYIFLILILFLYFLTREKIEKITKASLFSLPLLLLPPLIDMIVSGGAGIKNSYFLTNTSLSFWKILSVFKYGILGLANIPNKFIGISPDFQTNYGINIEVLIVTLLVIGYVFLKTKNSARIILSFLLLSPFYFLVAFLPYWLQRIAGVSSLHGVSNLAPDFTWNRNLFSVYFILSVILVSVWFFIHNKEKFTAIIKNLRFFRTLQILAMLFFGLYLAHPFRPNLRFFDILLILTACLSLIFYWAWGVLSNDLVDEESDRIDNPGRPLPSGKISRQEAKSFSAIFLIASYLSAMAVGYAFFITVFLRSCLAYLYSNPPFQLKRIPILSTFTLAFAALMTVFGGYLLVTKNSIYNFPMKAVWLVLLAFTLGFTAKDIKDYKGDKENGVKTIPVIFGLENGKQIIGIFSFICFILPAVIFPQYFNFLIGVGAIAGLASYFLINRKEYNEKPLLLIYFLYAVPVALYIFR